MIPVIDIFAGPGGLAEGFSSIIVKNRRKFDIKLSIEMEAHAFATLRLRAFCRQFVPDKLPTSYYNFVRGRLSLKELENKYSKEFVAATQETWQLELGECQNRDVDERIEKALEKADKWVLIGGPPCQAYSYAGIVGNRTKKDYTPASDKRYTLYEEYIRIMAVHKPAIFVLENVPGMLVAKLDRQDIFPSVIKGLSNPGNHVGGESTPIYNLFNIAGVAYDTETDPFNFLVKCEKYGIPQARHRVIVIGIRNDLYNCKFPPLSEEKHITAEAVLSDLPKLRARLSKESDSLASWKDIFYDALQQHLHEDISASYGEELGELFHSAAECLAMTEYLDTGANYTPGNFVPEQLADWYCDPALGGILHHQSRPQMRGDLIRYLLVASHVKIHGYSPKVYQYPKNFLPKHKNALSGDFRERFKGIRPDQPSHTIISHLSKDGHGFIHPDLTQCRSLTPREAARLQTFPDNYFFFGGRAAQYRQIGNAVPPLLAKKIAESLAALL